jgi:hypothetical protein
MNVDAYYKLINMTIQDNKNDALVFLLTKQLFLSTYANFNLMTNKTTHNNCR